MKMVTTIFLEKKKIIVKNLLKLIKKNIPNLKIKYAKMDIRKFNYKVNPFTYKLREGKNLKLIKYIPLESGLRNLINEKN